MPRESGHPVLRDDEIELIRHGVLDHPLSRMMTSEQATSFPVIASASEAIHGAASVDCFVAEFIIGPAEGGTRWLVAMTGVYPSHLAGACAVDG